jgi:hypothetical protein
MTSRSVPPAKAPDPQHDDPLDDRGFEEPEPPAEQHERSAHEARPGFDRILPELIRKGLKGLEAGRVPLEKVSESIFPKDLAAQLVAQLGDVRSGVVKAVAQEVGRFLRDADIASEVRKVLQGLDVEAQVRLRFKAREDGTLHPEVSVDTGSSASPSTDPRNERKKR